MRTRAWSGIPLAACRWRDGRALGSLAAPPLALLGFPAIRRVHVRFYGVCEKPLRRGRAGRNSYRNARLPDRCLPGQEAPVPIRADPFPIREATDGARKLQPLACNRV